MTDTNLPMEVVANPAVALSDTDQIAFRQGVQTIDSGGTVSLIRNYMLGKAPGIISTTTGIDGKTVANTVLYTVPAAKTLIITGFVLRATAATAITVGPSAGIGNISGTSNIFAAGTTAVTTTSTIYGLSLTGASVLTVAAGTIYFNLTVAATGTSETLAVDIIGYLL